MMVGGGGGGGGQGSDHGGKVDVAVVRVVMMWLSIELRKVSERM